MIIVVLLILNIQLILENILLQLRVLILQIVDRLLEKFMIVDKLRVIIFEFFYFFRLLLDGFP